jgi:hypothetical protein
MWRAYECVAWGVVMMSTGCGADVTTVGAGGGGTTSSTSTAGGGGSASLVASIAQVNLGANCMPVVGDDPVSGSITVSYENTGTVPGAMTLTRADLLFTSAQEGWVFPLELDPTTSGAVEGGQTLEVEHLKVATPGDSSFVCQLCGTTGSVALYFERGEQTASAMFDFGCVQ